MCGQPPGRARGADATAADIVKTTIYVVSSAREDLVAVWEVAKATLGRVPSTLLGVWVLGYPDQLVEIEAVAARPRARGGPSKVR